MTTIGNDKKAKLQPIGPDGETPIGGPISVQFNPATYSSTWNVTWQEVGQSLQWTKTVASNLVLILNYDSYNYEAGPDVDVRDMTGAFIKRLDPGQTGKAVGCLFHWGKITYKGVVESIKEDFSLFLADGTPVRSVITLTLKPWPKTAS